MFDGDTADPKTLTSQIAKVKQRFGLDRVVLVGDRGMITEARLQQDIKPAGLDWITALRAPAKRFIEFFTANIRNPNTRAAYARSVASFFVGVSKWGFPCWMRSSRCMLQDGGVCVRESSRRGARRLLIPVMRQRTATNSSVEHELVLLTADVDLHLAALKDGKKAENFNHLRNM